LGRIPFLSPLLPFPPKELRMPSPPLLSQEEMIHALYQTLADPNRRPVTAHEYRAESNALRNELVKNHTGLSATIEAHSQRDEQNFKALREEITSQHRLVNLMAKRTDDLEKRLDEESSKRRPSPYPGAYSSVHGMRSVMPPPGKPSDTGSWTIKPDYLAQIQDQINELHEARETAEKEAALSKARAEGAEEAQRKQARAAAEAEQAIKKLSRNRVRNLKIVLAVLAGISTAGPLLAWCASEAKHAATTVAPTR
jgi:hypothetical protein